MKDSAPAQSMFERPFWKFFGLLGDFFILTLYWVLTSLPIITIGASTAALFYVFLKMRAGEQGTLWGMYAKSFRENVKQAIFLWLLYLFLALDAVIIGWMLAKNGVIAPADFAMGGRHFLSLVIVCLAYACVMLYTAALLAMFKQTARQCILAAVGLAFGRIFSTLLFMGILAALGYITLYLFPPLMFIGAPLAIYLISLRMAVIFQKQIALVESRERAAQDQGNISQR